MLLLLRSEFSESDMSVLLRRYSDENGARDSVLARALLVLLLLIVPGLMRDSTAELILQPSLSSMRLRPLTFTPSRWMSKTSWRYRSARSSSIHSVTTIEISKGRPSMLLLAAGKQVPNSCGLFGHRFWKFCDQVQNSAGGR